MDLFRRLLGPGRKRLQPSGVTFVMGAGASYGAGFPLAAHLFDADFVTSVFRLATLVKADAPLDLERQPRLARALNWCRLVTASGDGFQRQFDQWVAEGDSERLDGFSDAISDVLFWAETAAFQTRGGQKITSVDTAFAFGAWLKTIRDSYGQVNVISFNYDLMVEWALMFSEFDYGSVTERMVSPPKLAKSAGAPPAFAPGISILKPHGSLNWMECRQCGHALCGQDNMWQASRNISLLQTCAKCGAPGLRPLFVAPVNSARSDFFAPVWEDIRRALQATEELFIIGYSFPEYDAYVRSIFREHVSPFARVYVIDPFAGAYPERYRSVFSGLILNTDVGFADMMEKFIADGGPASSLSLFHPLPLAARGREGTT